jgi:hypothetical protein
MASDLVAFIKKRDAQLRDAMQAELEALMVDAKTYHQNAVRNWKKKPKWRIHSVRSRQQLGAQLETTGDVREIWAYVDKGTGQYAPGGGAPYWIYPRSPGGKLHFQTGYDAKTRPIAKANVGSGQASGDWVMSDGVQHPGIKGRKFSQTYRERILEPTFKPRLVKRVRRV